MALLGACGKKDNIPTDHSMPVNPGIVADSICYSRHIEPMITLHCARCHPRINGVDFNGYDSAWAYIDRMIIRTVAGTMPASGPKLTAEQIDTLKAWRTNGGKKCD